METNARQFEKRGDPWVTERERIEYGNLALPKMRASEKSPFKDTPRLRRALTQDELKRREILDNMMKVRQLLGNHTRDLTPKPETVRVARDHYYHAPARSAELNPWDAAEIEAERQRLARDHERAVRDNEARKAKLFSDFAEKMRQSLA